MNTKLITKKETKEIPKDVKGTKSHRLAPIEVLNEGPIYICDACHCMLKVPDEHLEEEEIEDEDEDGMFSLLIVSYTCPRCNEKIIVSEDEIIDDEEEEPVSDKKTKSKSDSKSEHKSEHKSDHKKH